MQLTCFHFARGLLPASGASLCNVTAPSQGVWLPMQKQRIKTNKASAAYEKASISTALHHRVDARAHEAIFHSLPRLSASLSCNSASSLREASTSVILWNHWGGNYRFCSVQNFRRRTPALKNYALLRSTFPPLLLPPLSLFQSAERLRNSASADPLPKCCRQQEPLVH